jgi:endoglucanase
MRAAACTAVAGLALIAVGCGGSPDADAKLRVRDNVLVDGPGDGRVVRLLGVNRSGAEYTCIKGDGIFDGPSSARSIRAMKRWKINSVRLPLNEDCWLGINGVKPRFGGRKYRRAIARYVRRLHRAGLYVILDLHWAAPGRRRAVGIIPMADADHAPDFWRSVARFFRADRRLLFDLYNEPHGIGWRCWRDGCVVPAGGRGNEVHPTYRAAGMQELVDAVRATGAKQPIMLGGLDYARDLSGWLGYLPSDPLDRLVASEHNYGYRLSPCGRRCQRAIRRVHRSHPVVLGELGETDCGHGYIDRAMRLADRVGISYLGWTWNAVGGGWTCRGGTALIRNYRGKPTAYGIGFRDHFRELARR